MKTIKEAAKDSALKSINKVFDKNGISTGNHICGFEKGVKFAESWTKIEVEPPFVYESGDWNGLRSDFVLVKNKHGNVHIARAYIGIVDSGKFCDFVDDNDCVLSHITEWRPIELS